MYTHKKRLQKSKRPRKPQFYNQNLPRNFHQSFTKDLSKILDDFSNQANPELGWDPAVYKVDWLRENLLSKFNGPATVNAEERKNLAILKWLKMDKRNARTNIRLYATECSFGTFDSIDVLKHARKIILRVLGESPREDILDGMFSNGASTRIKRGPVAVAEKFIGEAHVTERAWPLFKTYVLQGSPIWLDQYEKGILDPLIVPGNVMFTVPKNTEIDRVACKEPEINMYMQRGVGNYIREQLLAKVGINLRDQRINQRLAREALKKGLATVDMSSASDLISEQLVRELLPFSWFNLLDDLRSRYTSIEGTLIPINMFSSMGNGFTFELESLLFYALTKSVCYHYGVKGRVSVYGDDIILPVRAAKPLAKVFAWFGFIINLKKSFWTGSFRESCGRHYYASHDVTPFFIRAPIKTQSSLILTLNQLRRWTCCDEVCLQYFLPELYQFWLKYSKFIPAQLHGGKDLYNSSCLVTRDSPRKRLQIVTREVDANPLGSYLQWLRSSEDHSFVEEDFLNELFATSTGTLDIAKVVVKRNRDWEWNLPANQCWQEEFNNSGSILNLREP